VPPLPVPAEPPGRPALGVLLAAGEHGKAHAAFVLATGAAALGRQVVVFATNAGCRALLADLAGLEDAGREARVRAAGVAGLEELRAAALELGVRLIACEAGLRAEALEDAPLAPGVEVAGIATFLAAIGNGQIVGL
jgi:peroxiredoxin family protein